MASALTHHRRLACPKQPERSRRWAGGQQHERARRARNQNQGKAPRHASRIACSSSMGATLRSQPFPRPARSRAAWPGHRRRHIIVSMLHPPQTRSRFRGEGPPSKPGPACVAVSCRALLSVAALNRRRGANGRRERCVLSHTSLLGVDSVEPWAGVWSRASQSLHSRGGGGPCTARGLGNGERRWWVEVPRCPGSMSLCALALLLRAATGPGQVPHDMVDAASCLVRGAQQRLGERAASWGPCLKSAVNQSLHFLPLPFPLPHPPPT